MDSKHNGHGDQQVSLEADKRHPDEFEASKQHFQLNIELLQALPGVALKNDAKQ